MAIGEWLAIAGLVVLLGLAIGSAKSAPRGRTCFGQVVNMHGTAGPDVLIGRPGADVILAKKGADSIFGLAGNDRVCAGRGDDTIEGGDGFDRAKGGKGYDICRTVEVVKACEQF